MRPCNSTQEHYLCDVRFVFYGISLQGEGLLPHEKKTLLIQMDPVPHILILS